MMANARTNRIRTIPMGLFLAWVFGFLFIVPTVVVAQADSDQAVVEYDGEVVGDESGRFSVTGNVRFSYDGMIIRSDTMHLEPGGEVAHFTGHVIVETEEQIVQGDRFVYDIPAGTSVLFQPRGTFEMESVEGPVYFRGDTMAVETDRVLLTGAMFTTCSCENPGYYIAGSRMEIFPGHKLVIYNVRFVESGIPLFYWPVLTIPLSDSARPPFQLPKIGHNSLEGWYIKTTLPYGPAGAGGGFVHLDWAQFLGVAAGITHFYKDDSAGTGQVHVYGLANTITGTLDPTVSVAGSLTQGNWNSSWEAEYKEDGWDTFRKQHTSGNLSLTNRRPDGQITANGSYSGTVTPTSDRMQISGNFRLNQRIIGNTRLNLSGDARIWEGVSAALDRRLFGYRADVGNSTGPITWSIVTEQSFNQELDKDKPSSNIPYRTLTRSPEILVGARPDLPLLGRKFPLTFELGHGRFIERRTATTVVDDTRQTALAQLRTMTFPLGSKLNLAVGGYVRGYWYGSGTDRIVLSSTYTATYRPTNRLTLRTTYDYLADQGATPFRFDRITARERVGGSVQYGSERLNVSLSSGYNLLSEHAEDLVLAMDATPTAEVSMRLHGVYSLRYGRLDSVTGAVELGDGEPISLKVGGKYSFVDERFERIDGTLGVKVGTWSLESGLIFDGKKGELERGTITLLKDLDCRKIGLSYSHSLGSEDTEPRREVWIEYRITAIPTLGVKVGSQDEGFMFNLDGWQELVGVE